MLHSADRIAEAVVITVTLLMMTVATGAAVAGSPEIRTDKDFYAPDEPISVQFGNAPGNNRDWITIVPKGTPVSRYKQYIYLKGETAGLLEFRGLTAGEYEARLFIEGVRSEIAAQHTFRIGENLAISTVDGKGAARGAAAPVKVRTSKDVYASKEDIEITFEGLPGHPRDWIAIAKRGAPDRRPLSGYEYLRGVAAGRATLRGRAAGDYEARAYKGGGYEVLARYPFTVRDSSIAATSKANDTADPQSPEDATIPSEAPDVASSALPAKPLLPELQGLVGTWIAHTECGPDRGRGKRPQRILLTVRPDAAKTSGVLAEVRGIDGTAGIALDVAFDADQKRYLFRYTGWLSTGTGYKQKPYGLTLAFLDERDLLRGEITGRTDCETVVAGKLSSEDATPNPKGLLYKVAVNRIIDPLTEEECGGYARWLTGGEIFEAHGFSGRFNSAVTDAAAMRRVLGHDLRQWTDEDARKIGVIHRACGKLLQASSDPVLVALAGQDYGRRGIAPPLRYAPSKYPDSWGDSWFALHRPLVADILATWTAIEEGLLAQAPEAAVAAPKDETGLVGEWRGYYRCVGGSDVFMRLTFAAADGPLDVRFEFGPGLKSRHPYGVLAMTGTLDAASRQVALEPDEWIEKPRGQVQPIGLEGRIDDSGAVIEGKVKGNPDCPDFSVTRRELVSKAVNPDGLLFKYLGRGMITATVADCRAYAEWLAAGDEIVLGGSHFFSGLRSLEDTRAVLGKDLYQWGEDDHMKIHFLSRHCKALLESRIDLEISELLARIENKKLVWVTQPLGTPRMGNTLSHWLRAEQLVMVNQQQQALAARKLAEANAMPPVVGSIDNIDVLNKEAGRGLRGPLGYLSKQELGAYYEDLGAARVKVAVATAGAAAEAWSRQPQTYADLEAVEGDYQSLRTELEFRKAPQGVKALDAAFSGESDRRADALWPKVLKATLDELHDLADADLLRFRELSDDQARQLYLASFHWPTSEDPYFDSYETARALYRETVERMVERSEPQLLAWIDVLPPSAGADELLDDFSQEVFAVAPIPDRHPALEQAASAKKRSYNPDGYVRPDIVMSLRRGQWDEVGLVGLEDLAYLATSLRTIQSACPRVVPEQSGPLMDLVWDLSQQAVGRIMQGQVQSKQEAERAFFLFMNNVVNQPGCRVDYFGNVVGCVTAQDHAAAQEFLLTSGEAQLDMSKLLRAGCGSEGAQSYVQGLIGYAAAGQHTPPAQKATDFWTWAARTL